MWRHFTRLADAAYLRRQGIIVESESVLESRSAQIGQYMGQPIWGSLEFMGMDYRFDHVLDRRQRERLGAVAASTLFRGVTPFVVATACAWRT